MIDENKLLSDLELHKNKQKPYSNDPTYKSHQLF